MRKSEYTKAVESVDELIATYQAAAAVHRDQVLNTEDFTTAKYFENLADGCGVVIEQLEHVRTVVIDAQKRTGAHWATRATA